MQLLIHIARIHENREAQTFGLARAFKRLEGIARLLSAYDTNACNRSLSSLEEEGEKTHWLEALELAKELHVELVRNTDPRGWSLLVKLPGGESNDFGGRGWGIHS